MSKRFIYLDHAAATPVDLRVLRAMWPYFKEDFLNPSSPYAPAVKVRREIEAARHSIAKDLGVKPGEIVFTAGATESINLAIHGIGGHIVTCNIEHEAVLASVKKHKFTIVPADLKGRVDLDALKKAIKKDTRLVSVAIANNELGTLQPIADVAKIIQTERLARLKSGNKTPIFLHCDGSQGLGQVDMSPARLGIDLLTLNSAKIYGPKQAGLLYVAAGVVLQAQILGGGQERGLRSGTENTAGVVGFAKALNLAIAGRKKEVTRLASLRDYLEQYLAKHFPDMVVSGDLKHRLASYLHVAFPGLDGERLVFRLESEGVMVATGSACAANKGTRSHVLTAIGMNPELADGSIRISLGKLSSRRNVWRAARIIARVVKSEYKRLGQ